MMESQQTLTIMSYNIRHGEGSDNVFDLDRIAEVIRASGADLIGLQEVDRYFSDRSQYEDTIAVLAEALGMHWCYAANVIEEPEPGREEHRQYGIAILSKYEIEDQQHLKLTSDESEQRGALYARVDADGTMLHFYCTHLGLEQEERLTQVQELLLASNHHKAECCILTGDFNAHPDDPEIAKITTVFDNVFKDAPDAYTFPAGEANETIDYILINPQVQLKEKEVIHSLASDHYPIVAKVCLNA
ncbi:endonuclease [Paenibacillus aquistagni]|nr:endonuclease [Paenibacillus aquistagni]